VTTQHMGEPTPQKQDARHVDPRRVYGIWTLADGREVLFDRDYLPLYSRRPGEPAEIAEPQRPQGVINEHFLWADRDSRYSICPATRRKLLAVLRAWGIR